MIMGFINLPLRGRLMVALDIATVIPLGCGFVRESGGMADTLDLGSSALRREGSSPFSRMVSFAKAEGFCV